MSRDMRCDLSGAVVGRLGVCATTLRRELLHMGGLAPLSDSALALALSPKAAPQMMASGRAA